MELSDSWADQQPTVVRVGAVEAVLADLQGAIRSGSLPVGTRLPSEAALATRYGVSRSMIREALRATSAVGLTKTQVGLGTVVVADRPVLDRSLGDFTIEALREARPHIEIPAARLAALRRSAAELDQLRELVGAMDAEQDAAAWIALDGRLHVLIAAASGNEVFAKIVQDISDSQMRQSGLVNSVPHRRPASNEEHRQIVEAIAAGSAAEAGAAMAGHLEQVAATVDLLTG